MNALRNAFLLAAAAASLSFGADPTLLGLAPADTKMVAGIYLDRTRNTPFGQFVLSQMKLEDSNFANFVASTGFDPRRDVNEVLVMSNSTEKHSPGLVLARGVFNGPAIIAAARKDGGVVTSYKGVDIVTHGKGMQGFAILDGAIALGGEVPAVQAAIDRRRAASSSLDSKLAAKIAQLSTQYDAWFTASGFVAPVGPAVPRPNVPGNIPVSALQSIESTSGGVKFGVNVQVGGEAITRSDKDAQALVDVARFLAGMLSMNSGNNPDAAKLAALAQNTQWTAQGTKVSMSLTMPESDLEQLLQQHGTRRAAVR